MSALTVRLKPAASRIFASPARFTVCCSGRRFGKSWLTVTRALQKAIEKPRSNVLLVAPTFEMVRQTLWRCATELTPADWLTQARHSTLDLYLKNGSWIGFRSGDRPDRLRGLSLDHAGLDEAAYLVKGLWAEVVRPALADRQGSALMTTTPAGTMQSWFYDLFTEAEGKDGWERFQFSTIEGGYVTLEEVRAARELMDARTHRAEFFGSFESPTGRCFPDFGIENISEEAVDNGRCTIHVGIDFNVATLPAILFCLSGDDVYVFDEVTLHNATTEALAKQLKARYPGRYMIAYPDPTGGARKTSASDIDVTDHSLLAQAGIKVYDRRGPYAVRDKLQTLNWLIRDANGRRRLKVHPRCKDLIRDLRFLVFKEGTDDPDKSDPERSHHSDAIGYGVLGAMKPLLSSRHLSGGTNFRVS
jgi:phage terminase large subunit